MYLYIIKILYNSILEARFLNVNNVLIIDRKRRLLYTEYNKSSRGKQKKRREKIWLFVRIAVKKSNNAVICVHCGVSQETKPTVVDNGGFGWGLLGCCIPIVGLILFLVWKDTKPKTSKAAGMGALVSVIISIVWYILVAALGIGAGLLGM